MPNKIIVYILPLTLTEGESNSKGRKEQRMLPMNIC
jgi:hypothetical protein